MIAARTIDETLTELSLTHRSLGSVNARACLNRIAGGVPREEAIADLITELADRLDEEAAEQW